MTRIGKFLKDKYCLIYCGPERCDCKRGHGLGDSFDLTNFTPPPQLKPDEKEEHGDEATIQKP